MTPEGAHITAHCPFCGFVAVAATRSAADSALGAHGLRLHRRRLALGLAGVLQPDCSLVTDTAGLVSLPLVHHVRRGL